MANPSSNKGNDVKLHPLVIMNISEHWTRVRAQNKGKPPNQIYGAILGQQRGRSLEMTNSFELRAYLEGVENKINTEFLRQRESQYKEVFPELELVGWYCTGNEVIEEGDVALHKQLCCIMDTPLLLKLDPTGADSALKLPMFLYENDASPSGLKRVPWVLVSEESERIGIDHVARLSTNIGDQSESELGKQIRSNGAAATMLLSRMKMIHDYLSRIENGSLPYNYDIVREANKLCQRLSLLEPAHFAEHFEQQQNDVNAALLLAGMTQLCGSLGELVTKVNTLSGSDRPFGTVGMPSIVPKKGASRDRFLISAQEGRSSASGGTPDLFQI